MFTEEFRLGRGRCRQGYNLISDAVLCDPWQRASVAGVGHEGLNIQGLLAISKAVDKIFTATCISVLLKS